MKRKGFTLVELLVVIAIIALLMGILMPALARVRQLAFRMTCGTNLSGIGKAMLIYANDYEDELPRAGGRNSQWGRVKQFAALDRFAAYGLDNQGNGGQASFTSCFYLLVKYSEVTPKSFICKGDAGTGEFKLSDLQGATGITNTTELIDLWDFGPHTDATNNPSKYCSYSYHAPFGTYALTTSSEPGFAVAADRNPWIRSPAGDPPLFAGFAPDLQGYQGNNDKARVGNAIAHQNDGQNVLFLDSHVEFAKRAFCSIEDDNIYTISSRGPDRGDPAGGQPQSGSQPTARKDSLLLHDDPQGGTGGGTTPKNRTCFAAETPAWIDGRLLPIALAECGRSAGMLRPQGSGVGLQIERVDAHPGVFADAYTIVLENGESLCVVGSHVFLLNSGAWVHVESLRAGSVLKTHTGAVRVIAAVHNRQPYVGTVYNLKIKDLNHYFVGRAGIVVRDY